MNEDTQITQALDIWWTLQSSWQIIDRRLVPASACHARRKTGDSQISSANGQWVRWRQKETIAESDVFTCEYPLVLRVFPIDCLSNPWNSTSSKKEVPLYFLWASSMENKCSGICGTWSLDSILISWHLTPATIYYCRFVVKLQSSLVQLDAREQSRQHKGIKQGNPWLHWFASCRAHQVGCPTHQNRVADDTEIVGALEFFAGVRQKARF